MRRLTAGVLLGIGLGGFADGIALHQIAQWHNIGLQAVLPRIAMEAMQQEHGLGWPVPCRDMVHHALAGVLWLWAEGRAGAAPSSVRVLAGEMLLGWGAFNLVEGVIDHHLLQLHHVRDVPVHVPAYDWIFLAVAGLGSSPRAGRCRETGPPRLVPPAWPRPPESRDNPAAAAA